MKHLISILSLFAISNVGFASDFDYADMFDGKIICELTDPENFTMDPPTIEAPLNRQKCSTNEIQPGCGDGWQGSLKGKLQDFEVEVLVGHTALYDLRFTHRPTGINLHWNSHPIPGTHQKRLDLSHKKEKLNARIHCFLN